MDDPHATPPQRPAEHGTVEMPRPTAAPLVLAAGIALLACSWPTNLAFAVVGVVVACAGLGAWIASLLPGRGHEAEPLVPPARRARAVVPALGRVESLERGMPGYRLRLPTKVHPISAGIKGGLAGGLLMPLPAAAYGVLSGHGVWLPVNLLAGLVLPGVDQMSLDELEQFHPGLLAIGLAIHATVALAFGLFYGVLMPTLPPIPRPLAWGAVLMPLLWSAASFVAVTAISPTVGELLDWPSFILSQFVFGVVAALIVMRFDPRWPVLSGVLGGLCGGALMTVPALAWGSATGHGIWYPVNLLAVMIAPPKTAYTVDVLEAYSPTWLGTAVAAHAVLSLGFGLIYGLLLLRLPRVPGPFAWGAALMPLFWTATSYALMGVVNPVLRQRVDWPWFVVSQFVFGLVAATVVVRSEQIAVPPAGRAPGPGVSRTP